jgi:hypothetical protein
MNWGWLQTAATGGFLTEVGRRLFDFLDKWFERKRDRAEKEEERRRAEAETVERDDARLLAHKIRLKGCSEWAEVVDIVSTIHSYFDERPRYLKISSNRAFLEKYPKLGAPGKDLERWLTDLKQDVDTLRVQ